MKTGELIRKYRKAKGLTQAELADACGLTDSAIRNYELCNRTPGIEQIESIASALGISPESLREVPLESSRQAIELLFRLEDEFGLVPGEIDGELVLRVDERAGKSQKLLQVLKAWKRMIDSEKAGEISPEELLAWKLSLR
ncbi:helix-turn-helix domain-containing protein [Enorma massiliensis]|uniref:helix-turn-helix domain-containing protein n=1 Tax=Enorma massiliensis TaxID=1472761 RepID=UPI003AF0A09E